jgi:quercetin dioxygenase-like cupin family protein
MEFYSIWGGDEAPSYPDEGLPLEQKTGWFPPVGGFRMVAMTVSPAAADADALYDVGDMESVLAEVEEKVPGLMAVMDPDDPGMHQSDTIDMVYVVSGELVLELSEGVEKVIKAGDVVVQSGTRHRWHNRGDSPAFAIGFICGAHRKS